MGVRRIDLRVEELVLDGFGRVSGERVALSFHRELDRLLREQPLEAPPEDWRIDVLPGIPALPPVRSARRLGIELARAVHTGLHDFEPGERP